MFGPTPVGAVDLEGFAEEDDADLAFSADDDGFEAPLAEDGELETVSNEEAQRSIFFFSRRGAQKKLSPSLR